MYMTFTHIDDVCVKEGKSSWFRTPLGSVVYDNLKSPALRSHQELHFGQLGYRWTNLCQRVIASFQAP